MEKATIVVYVEAVTSALLVGREWHEMGRETPDQYYQ